MQHMGGGWLGYTLRTWRTLWSRTHFQITGTSLGWIHWSQSSPMCVFDGQRFILTIFAGFVAHLMPSWGGWWTSTASPGNQRRNFHRVWWQIQKWRTWIHWTRWHQHPNPKPTCSLHTNPSGAMQPSCWENGALTSGLTEPQHNQTQIS